MRMRVIVRITFGPQSQRGLMVVAKGVNGYCDEDRDQDHKKDDK